MIGACRHNSGINAAGRSPIAVVKRIVGEQSKSLFTRAVHELNRIAVTRVKWPGFEECRSVDVDAERLPRHQRRAEAAQDLARVGKEIAVARGQSERRFA